MKYERDSLARQPISQQEVQQQEQGIEEIPVIREIRSKKARFKLKFSMVGRIALLFALGLLVIFRFAQITEIGYQINDIHAEYEKVVAENEQLQVQIEKQINLSEIRHIAETRLNLQAPSEGQIIYIETTTSDRTDYVGEATEETNAMQDVVTWIKDFLGIGA